jgi:hypothetical protein
VSIFALTEATQAAEQASKALADAIQAERDAADPAISYREAAKRQARHDGGKLRSAYGNALITRTLAAGGPVPAARIAGTAETP